MASPQTNQIIIVVLFVVPVVLSLLFNLKARISNKTYRRRSLVYQSLPQYILGMVLPAPDDPDWIFNPNANPPYAQFKHDPYYIIRDDNTLQIGKTKIHLIDLTLSEREELRPYIHLVLQCAERHLTLGKINALSKASEKYFDNKHGN